MLEKAVEVYAGRFVSQGIIHICDDPVPFGEVKNGDRPFSIDANDGTWVQTVRVGSHPSDVPVVGESGSAGHRQMDGRSGEKEQHYQGDGRDVGLISLYRIERGSYRRSKRRRERKRSIRILSCQTMSHASERSVSSRLSDFLPSGTVGLGHSLAARGSQSIKMEWGSMAAALLADKSQLRFPISDLVV